VNAPIGRLFGLVIVLFAVLIGFTSRWTVFEAGDLRANSLNKRDVLQEQRIRRGRIRAGDGTLLARSVPEGKDRFRREYPPAAKDFAHEVGYSFPNPGRAGLEAFYNDDLSGRNNELASILDELQGKRQEGDDLLTSLDPRAQRIALQGLNGRPGSVVAFDPRSGAIKVMASFPGFDPGAVAQASTFNALNRREGAPLLNRATQGLYPPGSTFKVVTAIAAIDSGMFSKDSKLSGKNDIPISGVPLRNDAGESFGDIDMTFALTHSVNTYWAQVAEKLGKKTMAKYMERLGFDRPVPVDLPRSQRVSSGVHTPDGRIRKPTSSRVDIGRVGIGQEALLATPLQMAMVAAAVANGGKLMKPHMGTRVVDQEGRTVHAVDDEQYATVMSADTARDVRDMMKNVVKEGTGTQAALEGIDVAGKTGTAEKNVARNIAQPWFIALAPADAPTIAIAVTIENVVGGFGGTDAAPIAKAVLQELLR
jgi:peptidoglycan glycosyltransferase